MQYPFGRRIGGRRKTRSLYAGDRRELLVVYRPRPLNAERHSPA